VSRHEAAYGYLPVSVLAFSSPDEFVKMLRTTGFDDVTAVPLTLGVVYLYTGRRGRRMREASRQPPTLIYWL
jgi:ubiquinone/menaquinone biosynthesis C-methylase UbiE